MGDLRADVELTVGADGVGRRVLSRDWEIWGPNGGYVAAIALASAAQVAARARPANATVHFLGVANFDDPIAVRASVQRAARTATSVSVRIDQGDRPILAAMVWAVDDDLDGYVHDDAPMPTVPSWRDSPTAAERFAAAGLERPAPPYPFWSNFEARPPSWIDDWDNRVPSRPLYQDWLRFLAGPAVDPWDQAARLLLLVDLGGWPAIGRRHTDMPMIAPSIDVSCEFHRVTPGEEWFLLQGESPSASDGLIATHQHVWNERGELLASGVSHLLCRRVGG